MSPHGAWIIVEAVPLTRHDSSGPIVQGELIAVDETAFHVLTSAGLQSLPRTSTHRITLVGYSPPTGVLAAGAVAGGVSTLSHGAFLIFTAPMWTVAGIAAFTTEKRAGVVHDVRLAATFARFPQGLPPDLDPRSLGALSSSPR